MKHLAVAGLCAGLAVAPLAARAADLVLFDRAGHPVAVLVPVAEPAFPTMAPIGFPIAGIFAQQDAMIQRMMSDMRALANGGMPMDAGPGSTMMVSSFSSGQGSCSRTVTYQSQPGGAPVVKISQTGDACGPMPGPNPRATTPVAEPVVPPPPTAPSRVYNIDYRHPAVSPAPHRG